MLDAVLTEYGCLVNDIPYIIYKHPHLVKRRALPLSQEYVERRLLSRYDILISSSNLN